MKSVLGHNRIITASLFAILMAVSAYATDYGDISVKIETITEAHSSTGYDEYRVTVINRSRDKSHRVMVQMRGGTYNDLIREVRRAIDAAPSSAATFSMFKPMGGDVNAWLVSIDGKLQDDPAEIDASRTSSWVSRSQNSFFALSSRDIEKMGLMNDATVTEGFKNSHGEIDVSYLSYKSPIAEWSGNWIGYTGFDAVMLTAGELREAPESVRSALWRYAECGGSLLIIGAWEIPKHWRSSQISHYEVEDGKDSSKKLSIMVSSMTRHYNVGFGQVTLVDETGVKSIQSDQWRVIKDRWKGSRPTQTYNFNFAEINNIFPVVDRVGIPVRGLFIMMLVFVVLIGPINLFWLARRRKKIWMLWTVPAIAMVTCLAITGFALFSEGFSATSRTEALTILDESSHRASTIGWMGFYTPMTPSEGLRLSYDTEVSPVVTWNYYSQGRGERTIDFSNDQLLDTGWVTARVPAYFKFRKSETRRERLTIRRSDNDSLIVVNGLGADIRELWFAGRNGRIYSGKEIRAGAEMKLTLTNMGLAENISSMRELFIDSDWPGKIKGAAGRPQIYLTPGCYMATFDKSPFVEEGLKNVAFRKGGSMVYGISAEAER